MVLCLPTYLEQLDPAASRSENSETMHLFSFVFRTFFHSNKKLNCVVNMYLLSYTHTHTQKWHRQGFKLSSCPIFLRNVYCWSEKELTEWACHELFNICISLCICTYCGMFGGQRTACGTESLFPLNYVIVWYLKMEFMSSGPASNSSLVYRQFEHLYSDEISSVDVNSLLRISKLLSFYQTLRWIPTPTHTQSMVYMRYVVREPRVFFSPPRFWGPNSGCENWCFYSAFLGHLGLLGGFI